MNNRNACTKFEKIFEEIDGIRDDITTTINGEKNDLYLIDDFI